MLFFSLDKGSHSMSSQNLSEKHGPFAVSDLVRILLSLNDHVRLQLMAPNILPATTHCLAS
jgi:hypothetical protein